MFDNRFYDTDSFASAVRTAALCRFAERAGMEFRTPTLLTATGWPRRFADAFKTPTFHDPLRDALRHSMITAGTE